MFSFHNRRAVERKLKEKLKDDRARMQFGRISNFGLLEMTRQRLRESYVKWKMVLSIDSFALKIIKKGEEIAFSNKAKIININVPTKVKAFIDENLSKEVKHFKQKYKLEFNVLPDAALIVPEYKIELLNKNKKIINKVENIEKADSNPPKQNYNNNFINKKFKKNFKKRRNFNKRFRYRSKNKKNNFENKKSVNY